MIKKVNEQIYFIMSKNKINKKKTWKFFKDLFPVNRSLTGSGNKFTLNYLKKKYFTKS